ncbi:MAG: efflux RND transporter periplasmic adaptor subunit, partial [Zoogloeaceae bacterium]|nr:efflux RND transporter periplasmic adaptor subunit [Zoogloeaceae bacterium]
MNNAQAAKLRLIFIIGIAAAIIIPVWWLFSQTAAPAASTGESIPAGAFKPSKEQWANLKLAQVNRASFRSAVTTDGVIAFNEDALTPVFSPYSGRVTKVIAKAGDIVAKGDPLLMVDASEYVQAVNDLAAAQTHLETARAAEKRQRELFAAGAAAEKDLRQAQADLANAESVWSVARGQLRIFGKSDSDIDQLGKHRPATGEAVVAAPIAGTITQRQVGVGQYIVSAAAGAANPVMTIGDLSTVWLVANVRESETPRVKAGQLAEVTALALPNETFSGKVDWIGPALDPATHRLPVRVTVKNPAGVLKPQMFASFSIITSDTVTSLAVPESALIHDGD